MNDRSVDHSSPFSAWVIALGAALVGMAVAAVVVGLATWPTIFVGLALFVTVGLVLTPLRPLPRPQAGAARQAAAPVVASPVAAPAPAGEPASAALVAGSPTAPAVPQVRPAGLAQPRGGAADDLKIIVGIGPKLEALCNRLGFWHFDQLAAWTDAEVAWVDDNLEGFRGRVTRDRWVAQAKAIVALGPQEFLRRVDAGESW